MKLAGIKGEDNVTLFADLMLPIGKIVEDKKYANVFPIQAKKDETAKAAFVRFCFTILPHMLKDHKDAVAEILAIVSGKEASEMSFADIVKGIKELAQDEVFLSFFNFAATKTEESPRTDTSTK